MAEIHQVLTPGAARVGSRTLSIDSGLDTASALGQDIGHAPHKGIDGDLYFRQVDTVFVWDVIELVHEFFCGLQPARAFGTVRCSLGRVGLLAVRLIERAGQCICSSGVVGSQGHCDAEEEIVAHGGRRVQSGAY